MKTKSRNAFTMIELLIVIAIIVILAGGLMIYGEETMASAKANNVILNMKDLKRATMEWYTDNFGGNLTFEKDGENLHAIAYKGRSGTSVRQRSIQDLFKDSDEYKADVTKYSGNPSFSINNGGQNKPYTAEDGYALTDALGMSDRTPIKDGSIKRYQRWYVAYQIPKDSPKVKEKLANRALAEGLLKNDLETYDGVENYVYMLIIDLSKNPQI